MNLVILGNGFDLLHNLPTTFSQYRDFLEKYLNNELIDSELEEVEIFLYDNSTSKENVKDMKEFVDNTVFSGKIDEFADISWSNYEVAFQEYLVAKNDQISRDYSGYTSPTRLLAALESLVEKTDIHHRLFQDLFVFYLRTIDTNVQTVTQVEEILNEADLIVTFNYTDTYKNYFNNDVGKMGPPIFHIHGNLKESSNVTIAYQKNKINPTKYNFEKIEEKDIASNTITYFTKETISLVNSERKSIPEVLSELSSYNGKIRNISILGWSMGESDYYFMHVIKDLLIQLPSTDSGIVLNADEIVDYVTVKFYCPEKFSKTSQPHFKGILKSLGLIKPQKIRGNRKYAFDHYCKYEVIHYKKPSIYN